MSDKFVVKDSGQRQQFDSGMVRDVTEGKINYLLIRSGPMFKRWAAHLTKGAKKYSEDNWLKAAGPAELKRFRESAARHFEQWLEGDRSEDHASAIMFNITGVEYVLEKIPARRSLDWAVGLFEGEGTIITRERQIRKGAGTTLSIEVSLTSTDRDVVEQFAMVLDTGTIYGPYQYGKTKKGLPRKPFWKWQAYDAAAKEVLVRFLSQLNSRRAEKARQAIRFWDSRPVRAHYSVSRKGMGGRPTHKGTK
jgi:hypothetical protein